MTIASLMVKLGIEGADGVKRGLSETKNEISSVERAAGHASVALGRMEATFKTLAVTAGAFGLAGALAGVVAAAAGVSALGRAAAGVGVEMDSLYRGLATVSDNAQDLTSKIAVLRDVAKAPGLGFGEAIQGAIRLQSVGLGFDTAANALRQFGNAIASVGGGKEQLDGVTLALTQIVSKGKVSAEEINQLQERVPQIRRAMSQAFGTADTETLQARGIGAEDFITRIVKQLETLPRASGGARNAIENLGDSLKKAMEPLGRGLVMGLEAASPAVEKLVAKFEQMNTFLGEGIAAVISSGALTSVLDSLGSQFAAMFGKEPKEAFASFAGSVLAFLERLPGMVSEVGTYLKSLFASIYDHMMQIPRQMMALSGIDPKTGQPYTEEAFSLDPRKPMFPRLARQATDAFNPTAVPNYPVFPGFNSTVGMDARANSLAADILGAFSPMSAMPSGLLYGGNPGMVPGDAADKDSLKKIERNTRDAADLLSLRQQTLGGGALAGLGVTAAEIASQRGANMAARYKPGFARNNVPGQGIDSEIARLIMETLRTMGHTTMRRA